MRMAIDMLTDDEGAQWEAAWYTGEKHDTWYAAGRPHPKPRRAGAHRATKGTEKVIRRTANASSARLQD